MSAQKKALQGSETEIRELLGGAEENSATQTKGVIDLPSDHMNDSIPIWPIDAFFPCFKVNPQKNVQIKTSHHSAHSPMI